MDVYLTPDQLKFQKKIRGFLENEMAPVVEEIDKTDKFPMVFYRLLAENNFLAMNFPKEYGGAEADCITCAILVEEIAKWSSSVSGIVTTAGMTGPSLLLIAGTDQQKQKWLPGVATADTITAFAITEPNCGSDVTNLVTSAERQGDHYSINGTKIFITHGTTANIFLVVARTGEQQKSFSVFLVERDRPGFTVSKKFKKLGWTCQDTNEISLNNVIVPKENRVGAEGRGLADAMASVGFTRILLGACGLGVAEAALQLGMHYAENKCRFGIPLARRQEVRASLARIAVEVEAGRHLIFNAARMMDAGLRHRKEAAMAKYYGTQLARNTTREMLKMYGIEGFTTHHKAAVGFRDTPIFTIADGTSEIQLENIARELGLIKSGEMGA